jgi:hypothetical protein
MSAVETHALPVIWVPSKITAANVAEARANLIAYEMRRKSREHPASYMEDRRNAVIISQACFRSHEWNFSPELLTETARAVVYRKSIEEEEANNNSFRYAVIVSQAYCRSHEWNMTPELLAQSARAAEVVPTMVPIEVFMTGDAFLHAEEQCARAAEAHPGMFSTTRQVFNLEFDDWIARVCNPENHARYNDLVAMGCTAREKNLL